METIYLDHNATTPVAPEVREAMLLGYLMPGNEDEAAELLNAYLRRHTRALETT